MKSKGINFKSEKGISLVEVLLSVALLAIIAGPLLGAGIMSAKNNVTAKEKTEAVALAEKVMEEIKSQGAIGETSGSVPYTGVTSGSLAAYYNVLDIDKTTPGGIVFPATTTGSPEKKAYKDKIEAANKADFVLEIDQGSSFTDKKVYVTLKQNDGTILGTSNTEVNVINDRLLLRVTDSDSSLAVMKQTNSSNIMDIGKGNISNIHDVKLKVIYINNLHNLSEKLKIYTTILSEGITFNAYVMDDDQLDPAVTFSPKDGSSAECFATYLDSTYYDYKSSSVNVLYKITVEIKKKDNVIYTMSSYVKK